MKTNDHRRFKRKVRALVAQRHRLVRELRAARALGRRRREPRHHQTQPTQEVGEAS